MKKYVLIFISISMYFGCSNNQFVKVSWDGELTQRNSDINYVYWRDGVEFVKQQKDSVSVSMAGFAHENLIYVLVSFNNATDRPITYIHRTSKLSYQNNGHSIELEPVRPKNLDADHLSFFNTILVGAGSITRLFINLPVDMLLKPNNKDQETLSNIDNEYHDDDTQITKKVFIGNHTVFPEGHYAGFMVFEMDKDLPLNNDQFSMTVLFDDKIFTGVGSLSY